jgi:peptidoglycan/xylan/chitin deacetylase (PgdA/CDA1 family)
MQILKRSGYSVVSLDDGLRRLQAGDLDPASVAITFDDGFFNYYQSALPVLETLGYPVSLYLTTFYSDLQEPIFDLVCPYMLWKSRNRKLDLKPITGDPVTYQLSDDGQSQQAVNRIQRHATDAGLSAPEKADLSDRIAAQLSFDIEAVRDSRILNLMTSAEVADASRRGTSIELHTHRHRTPLDRNKFLREIEDNRQRIIAMTGRAPSHFCYPSGVYNEIFFPWLEECGVISATTCDVGMTSRATILPRVPRLVDVTALNDVEFEGWLCGIAAALPKSRRPPMALLPDHPTRKVRRRIGDQIRRARLSCQAALETVPLADVHAELLRLTPPGQIGAAWPAHLWAHAKFPQDAQLAIAELGGQSRAGFGVERVILLCAALRSLERLQTARLDPYTQELICKQYEFFANPGEDWLDRFDSSTYSYRAYTGMSILERFPAGRLDWETSGFPRSWLAKIPKRDLAKVLKCIFLELGGFSPVAFTHLAFTQGRFPSFLEQEVKLSYLRIVRSLVLRPEIKAILTASWIYSQETHRVSPHLAWTTRMFEQNGGVLTDLGKSPPNAGFLVGSRERTLLYESGKYAPTEAVIVWPRRAALAWLARQADANDL